MSDRINVLLIGVGPHANKVYLPGLRRLEARQMVMLHSIVDLKSARKGVRERLRRHGFEHIQELYIDDGDGSKPITKIDPATEKSLGAICERFAINAVIISTDPIAHKCYALWALSRNLPILMDKPLTARINTAFDIEQARGIYQDYVELLAAYNKSGSPLFSLSSQRRYHPGFKLVFEKVTEILDRFHCPITAIQCTHADGQWRMPAEIITQKYHPYNIYGKVSHGGYHFIDMLSRFIQMAYGEASPKSASDIQVFSSFVRPRGLLQQLNRADYERIFGEDYEKVSSYTDEELYEIYERFGEIDVASLIQISKGDDPICNITLNLLHNSFSRRSWLQPGKDLYKGNGRVKQEYFSIQQGPFQNIQIHSYQKNDRHEASTVEDYYLGGNNHFDIYIFRNKEITGDRKPLEVISMQELAKNSDFNARQYVHDQVKFRVLEEFIAFLLGKIKKTELTSTFQSHQLSVLLMSLIYQSGALKQPVSHSLEGFLDSSSHPSSR